MASSGWLRRLFYASPFYRRRLGADAPRAIAVAAQPIWPGDAVLGAALVVGDFSLGGVVRAFDAESWSIEPTADALWQSKLHGFDWLDHLAAVRDPRAGRLARRSVEAWIDRHGAWDAFVWRPDILGRRIANWLVHHAMLVPPTEPALRARLLDSLGRQARHLASVLDEAPAGRGRISALKGHLMAEICFDRGRQRIEGATRRLAGELPRQVLPDGGHASRSPSVHLGVLMDLIELRDLLQRGRQPVHDTLTRAIVSMAAILRLWRHGDGGLALFHASEEGDVATIDEVLRRADGGEASASVPIQAPATGYQRIDAGRGCLIMDTGAPSGLDGAAYASTLAIEYSHGRERILVNCGTARPGALDWRVALRATAAHSALVVDDTNSSEILADGGVGQRPSEVRVHRDETDGNVWIEASHDGYHARLTIVHRRRLFLAVAGDDLRGEERVTGRDGVPFAVRFHLHPTIEVALGEDGAEAALRTPSGTVWRFRAAGGALALEDSIYHGRPRAPQRTRQIVIHADTGPEGDQVVKWSLRRVSGRD